MVSKSYVCISGAFEFRIDINDKGEKEYFITKGPDTWEHLEKVNKEEFRTEVKKFSWCKDSWDKKLREDYNLLLKEI